MKSITLILTICFSFQLLANSYQDQILCGDRPDNDDQEKEQIFRAKKLERDMPPISNQNPANWCYAFLATDHLNYLNYTQSKLYGSKESFYNNKNMISPIESSYALTYFNEKNAEYKIEDKGQLDLLEGGSVRNVFLGYQELNYQSRSLKQVPFNSSNYTEDNNFQQINNWLYQVADNNNLLDASTSLHNYSEITSQLIGSKDIKITPFTIDSIQTDSIKQFLSTIRSTLYPSTGLGAPLSLNICGDDIKDQAISKNKSRRTSGSCDSHVVTIIGAFWKKGQCSVRIRNTWGKKWGQQKDGHIELSINKLLETHQRMQALDQSDTKYTSSWLSLNNDNKISERRIDEFYIFEGKMSYILTTKFEFSFMRESGSEFNLKGDKTKAYRFEIQENLLFTGSTFDNGNLRSGKLFNAKFQLIGLFKYKWSDNQYYTGTVREQKERINVINGTFYDRNDNVLSDVKDGRLVQ